MAEARLLDRLTASDLFLLLWDDYGWATDIGALAILDGTSLLDRDGGVAGDDRLLGGLERRRRGALDGLPRGVDLAGAGDAAREARLEAGGGCRRRLAHGEDGDQVGGGEEGQGSGGRGDRIVRPVGADEDVHQKTLAACSRSV